MNVTLPEQLDALLSRLKGAIRRYVLLRGIAIFLTTLAFVFWLSLSIDTLWFSSTRLELSRGVRLAILIGALSLLIAVLFHSVIWQLLVQLKRRALALLLEKRFPELNDRLITVVEAAEEQEGPNKQTYMSSLSQNMLQRTLSEACKMTESLQIDEVFNPRPLRRAIVLAVIALVSVGATAIASPETMSRWTNAYLKLADEYWNRVNGLQVFVLAQPGDRLRSFEDRTTKHAAGTDLTLMVETQPGKLTPPQVLLTYRTKTGGQSRALMTPAGEGKFRHTIGNLVEDLEFYITGGDFTTIHPYRVMAVPEPQIASLTALCNYPAYTGWNNPDSGHERQISIAASELTVPMETQLDLRAQSTKPLVRIRVAGDDFELEVKRDPLTEQITAYYRVQDESGLNPQNIPFSTNSLRLISDDGTLFQIPVLVSQRVKNSGDQEGAGNEELMSRLVLDEAESLRIYLEDTDGIMNLEPTRLRIQGRPDEAPAVQTRLAGIGKSITRRATIPLSGSVQDDYGLNRIHFEYRVGDQERVLEKEASRQPGGQLQFVMDRSADQPLEKFDIMPLELKVDDLLFVSLVATDGDDLNGPHRSKGETYRMKIVSDEELLSLLHQDEMNLRRRYEQVIDEITRARDDLDQAIQRETQTEGDSAQVSESIQRALNIIQKDVVETDAIRAAFDGIREELVNNRIETPQMRSRLVDKIIVPLGRIIQNEYAQAEDHLRLVDFSLRNKQTAAVGPRDCLADMDRLISSLAQILQEMRKLESFQEVIELLKGIIEDEKALKAKTEAERKKKLIDLLN